jgi:putative addiction module component (TIGR02574 family)
MSSQASQILADALLLDEEERAHIAQELLATLPTDLPDIGEDDLEQELQRRLDEYQQDPSTAVEWSQLRRSSST